MARVRAKVDEVTKKLELEHQEKQRQKHKPFVCQCAKCKGLTSNEKK
jgi:hypothetical protein